MTVDRFASYKNSKCSRFNSKYLCPSTEAVNAFEKKQSKLASTTNLPKCLTHFALSTSGTTGILMLPCWPSTTFWPLLFEKQNRFLSIIHDVLYLPSTVLEQGDYEGSFIGSKNFDSQVLALYLKVR